MKLLERLDAARARRPVRWVLGLLAGLLVCFAMPPWGWWPLAPIGIGLWGWLLDELDWRGRFAVGAFAGLGWFLPSTMWMWKFTPIGWPVGVAIWFPFILGTASAICPPGPRRYAALAATLIVSEWVRWHAPFGGVPLSMLAMTQARGPLLPVARIGGSLLVSAAVAVFGAGLGAFVFDRNRWGAIAMGGTVLVALLGVIAPAGARTRTITAATVQGGGPQQTRSSATDYSLVIGRHLRASQAIVSPVDLVVWPENVVNVSTYEGSAEQAQLVALAQGLRTTLVAGIVEVRGDPTHFYNAVVAIGPDGRQEDRYDKVRRVPFGEYVPLRNLLDPIARAELPPRDAIPGTGPAILRTRLGRLGVAISWEVFFGRRLRDSMHENADILLNPTNGSSYWLTEVQTQQIASSTLRAVESGRWLLQAAPTGFSAIIDPAGNVVARSSIGEAKVLERRVELRHGRTIASDVGDLPALLLALVLFATAWAANRDGLPTFNPKRSQDRHGVAQP